MKHIVRIATTLGVGVMALASSGEAIAAPPTPSGEVLVEASRASVELEQRSVSYRDLRLETRGAQRQLMRRVSFAIDSLCAGGDMGVTDPINALKCDRSAWEVANSQAASLITR